MNEETEIEKKSRKKQDGKLGSNGNKIVRFQNVEEEEKKK